MSDRIEFYEVRKGTEDDWDHVCLAKSEEQAEFLKRLIEDYDVNGDDFFIVGVEIVASTNLEISDYY